jgi:hypothetical protein
MHIRGLIVALGTMVATPGLSLACDAAFSRSLEPQQRLSDSLRIDKPGLARVFAADGSEFTAGQALWLKGRLRALQAACARGSPIDAAAALGAVRDLIAEHAAARR